MPATNPNAHYKKVEAMIPMRDGVCLYTAIYAPTDGLEHPLVMQRTPYCVGNYGATESEDLSGRFFSPYSKARYIIVMQDVRGRHMSQGHFEHVRPVSEDGSVDEVTDTYDTIEWLVHHTLCNGRVGIMGTSYLGYYALIAALCAHPALKAVSPQAPIVDWVNGDDLRHNGAFFLYVNFNFCWGIQHGWDREVDPTRLELVGEDIYWNFLFMGPTRNFTWRLNRESDLWNMVTDHPNYDRFWRRRALQCHLHEVRPAMLVVGGLLDAEDPWGVTRAYRALRYQSPATETNLVLGPWSHGQWNSPAEGRLGDFFYGSDATAEYFINHIEYPFFARHLEDNDMMTEKSSSSPFRIGAHIYFTGENKWHYYPLGWNGGESKQSFYFHPAYSYEKSSYGRLLPHCRYSEYSPVLTSYDSFPDHPIPYIGRKTQRVEPDYMNGDQHFVTDRQDVAVFCTEVLESDMRVAGQPEVELFVSLTTTDADFIVKIIDVHPDGSCNPEEAVEMFEDLPFDLSGYQQLIRWEVLRGKYRNSLDYPEPFAPGVPTRVAFRMPDMAHVFRAGHRLMIVVQSTMFPLIDRHPQTFCNIYEAGEEDYQQTTVSLFHTREYPSRIVLPVE